MAINIHSISSLEPKYLWPSIMNYDMRFCTKYAMYWGAFNTLDNDLFMTMLNTTAFKASALKCFYCQGCNYKVSDCPSPTFALDKNVSGKMNMTIWVGSGFPHMTLATSASASCPVQDVSAFYQNRQQIHIKYQYSCKVSHCKQAHKCRNY